MSRRLARELALRILYWFEQGNGDIKQIIKKVLEIKKYSQADKNFTKKLVEMTINNLPQIDREIIKVLKNWKYGRVSVIDKLLLRLGTCEIVYFNDIPYQVAINEAIEIGKKYGNTESSKFINGILDAIATASRSKKGIYESSNNK